MSDKPYVGMHATYRIGSDQYAGIITEVSKTGHQVTWSRTEDLQKTRPAYEWSKRCSRRRNGEYLVVGSKHGSLKLGVASTFLDEGF
jgi:hypothetical protein